jgi:hypothetical protein
MVPFDFDSPDQRRQTRHAAPAMLELKIAFAGINIRNKS